MVASRYVPPVPFVAVVLFLAGCGGSVVNDSVSCSEASRCGGSVVGRWSVVASCGDLSGKLPIEECSDPVAVRASNYEVTGSITFGQDGTYAGTLTTSADIGANVPLSCLTFQGLTFSCEVIAQYIKSIPDLNGIEEVTCRNESGGCGCSARMPAQTVDDAGSYTAEGGVLSMSSTGMSSTDSDYCVDGTRLTISNGATPGSTYGTYGMGRATLVAEKQ